MPATASRTTMTCTPAAGRRRGAARPELVVSDAPGGQIAPAIAAGETPDVYLVAWADQRTSDTDIYGQRIAWNGAFLQSEFAVSAQPTTRPLRGWPMTRSTISTWPCGPVVRRSAGHLRPAPVRRRPASRSAVGHRGRRHENEYPGVAYSPAAGCFVAVWDDFQQNVMEGRRIPPAGDATSLFSLPGIAGAAAPPWPMTPAAPLS